MKYILWMILLLVIITMKLYFYFLALFMFLVMVNGFQEQERKHYSPSYLASENVVDVMKGIHLYMVVVNGTNT